MANAHNPAAIFPGSTSPGNPPPSRLAILPRVLLITLALTGLTFAVSLLLAILTMLGLGILRGHLPDMRMAYRHFAMPVAATVGSVAFVSACIHEIRHYQRAKVLNQMEMEQSR